MRRNWLAIAAMGLALVGSPAMAQHPIPGPGGNWYDCRDVSISEVEKLASRSPALYQQDAELIAAIDMRPWPDGRSCRVILSTTYQKATMNYSLRRDSAGRMMIETQGVEFIQPVQALYGLIFKTPQGCRGNLEEGSLPECTDHDVLWKTPNLAAYRG